MARSLGRPVVAEKTGASTGWLRDVLTLVLVVPSGAVAVLFLLEIDIPANRETRRVLAAGAALAVPVVLFGLRGAEALLPASSRAWATLTGLA